MKWDNDEYVRTLLDGREKWGTFLSLTAIAALFSFLSQTAYANWVNFIPLAIGAFGALFVLVAACYLEQAEASSRAMERGGELAAKQIKDAVWSTFIRKVGIFGWLHITAPPLFGFLATVALCCGKN